MNVLMTGVTGFIGSHLAERLLLDGNEVHAIVRPSSRIDSLSDFLRSRVKFHVRDENHSIMDIVDCEFTKGGGEILHSMSSTIWQRIILLGAITMPFMILLTAI